MIEKEIKNRILYLIKVLNEASDSYYNKNIEMMSNFEYDKLYDELEELEKKYNLHYSNSPTNKIGAELVNSLPKTAHEYKMLSLDKTKNVEDLISWLGDKEGVLSYKLDGLTIVLTYDDGNLVKAVTRGNGETGEIITENAKCFMNVPLKLNINTHLVIRGEAIIKYSDFEKINEEINDDFEKYKNPRNLCSGSVRQLNPNVTKKRRIYFNAFSMISDELNKKYNKYNEQLEFLNELGFDTVYYKIVNENNIEDTIKWYEDDVKKNDNPSDGLVLMFNDIQYGLSLGSTSKFPKNAIAFKWQDEVATTILREIEWSPSRTGLINPVAIFHPVELEGTTVKRASLHNLSIMDDLSIGIGDKINVYKANMIIPQIAENLTKSNNYKIPEKCPSCDMKLHIHNENGVKTLHCENESCPIKHIKNFENFVSRNCMNIDGISIQTIEKFISLGFIKEYSDLFKLEKYKNEIINLDGFGEKSYSNIIKSINDKKQTECFRVINSLGITGIGTANAKLISNYFSNDINKIINANIEELCAIDSIGPILAKSIYDYFRNKNNIKIINNLLKVIEIKTKNENQQNKLNGMTFVITGSLINYDNREMLVKIIEDNGGKVATSVSKKTNYLINNDLNSNSSKNKTAKSLNIPIIDEKKFEELIQ